MQIKNRDLLDCFFNTGSHFNNKNYDVRYATRESKVLDALVESYKRGARLSEEVINLGKNGRPITVKLRKSIA